MDKKQQTPNEGQIKAVWGDPGSVEQTFVDEMFVQVAGDRAYITFGQVRLPKVGQNIAPGTSLEIKPMVRLIVTTTLLQQMTEALNQLPGAAATKENKP